MDLREPSMLFLLTVFFLVHGAYYKGINGAHTACDPHGIIDEIQSTLRSSGVPECDTKLNENDSSDVALDECWYWDGNADGVCMVCAVFKYNTIADLYQEMGIDIIDIIRTGIRQKLRASAVTECNELPGGLGICFCEQMVTVTPELESGKRVHSTEDTSEVHPDTKTSHSDAKSTFVISVAVGVILAVLLVLMVIAVITCQLKRRRRNSTSSMKAAVTSNPQRPSAASAPRAELPVPEYAQIRRCTPSLSVSTEGDADDTQHYVDNEVYAGRARGSLAVVDTLDQDAAPEGGVFQSPTLIDNEVYG